MLLTTQPDTSRLLLPVMLQSTSRHRSPSKQESTLLNMPFDTPFTTFQEWQLVTLFTMQ